MKNDKYYQEFEDFMKNHPEITPALRPLVEPPIQGVENQLYAFIISYIFM
jgi:hypothetical protein